MKRERLTELLVDWNFVGLEFRRHGWTQARVAETLNLPHSTVRDWFSRGKEPGYSNAYRCLALYGRICLNQPTTVRFYMPIPKLLTV